MDAERIARLSEGQRICLRMVLRHMSSKEIARALGISRHTVDQRLRLAMQTLQAANRIDAARALAEHEGTDAYQSFVHQPPDIDPLTAGTEASSPKTSEGSVDGGLRKLGWSLAIIAAAATFFGVLFIALNALSDLTK